MTRFVDGCGPEGVSRGPGDTTLGVELVVMHTERLATIVVHRDSLTIERGGGEVMLYSG